MKFSKYLLQSLPFICFMSICACTEEVILDMPKGDKRPVVEGYFTNELKRHEVILSYSSEVYSDDKEMITGAEVYVTGGGRDTVYYYEQPDKPGHYLTDSVAGTKNRWYHWKSGCRKTRSTMFPFECMLMPKCPTMQDASIL